MRGSLRTSAVGGVPPGETPPCESDTRAGISFPQDELRHGWAALPIVLISAVAVLMAVGLIAMVVALLD